jgi:hypothetical protein
MRGRARHTGFWWENVREREPFGKPGHELEDNIKTDLKGIGLDGVDWVNLV